ncbi:23S rRNA (adenine(1618)-N(6))-methyltransferase RlmF [Alteromonas sp. C1M14]|uniref:23S rRNA (adenine(1618)-N(6))-methyltransferase RlmF n=1 Tax=Alteromonas sp. C1M14 TaxID=2841567 RepID=UPI001C08AE27|nr:23S rRNA (adenine(1618)-N(6))-methyltransferase RlmF [Alteromonas sp. C1M14]MBU2979308.1 23S rRNA (adenine(1618)-N(6))-methyltransferase RlmF [Alteromonas sp. C1M14]
MHARNLHKNGYPMAKLCQTYPALSGYLKQAKSGKLSIDFADPKGVKALNAALLAHYYHIKHWDIPQGYLCPPIPGRADYIHGIADLLASENHGEIPTGKTIKGLDIGVGANGIYPIIGSQSYGWTFVGSDIDSAAVKACQTLVTKNTALTGLVTVRHQQEKQCIFKHIIQADDYFAFSLCNPPFHKSANEARKGTALKTENLGRNKHKRTGKAPKRTVNPGLNFGGMSNELWCDGGELAFIQTMIKESVAVKDQIGWFTCLVSKSAHLKPISTSVNYYGATQFKKIEMGQGQKQSRFVAWTFR